VQHYQLLGWQSQQTLLLLPLLLVLLLLPVQLLV
jgi:hypothetical protein